MDNLTTAVQAFEGARASLHAAIKCDHVRIVFTAEGVEVEDYDHE
jgi:cysteine sulfinate desulfinase/cysteine desulfurase-like protein